MKTKTFEALMLDGIAPCCGYSIEDVEVQTMFWDCDFQIAICTCGRIIKLDQAIGLITVMERE